MEKLSEQFMIFRQNIRGRLRSLPLFCDEIIGRCYRSNKALSLRTANFVTKLQSFAINLSRMLCLEDHGYFSLLRSKCHYVYVISKFINVNLSKLSHSERSEESLIIRK